MGPDILAKLRPDQIRRPALHGDTRTFRLLVEPATRSSEEP